MKDDCEPEVYARALKCENIKISQNHILFHFPAERDPAWKEQSMHVEHPVLHKCIHVHAHAHVLNSDSITCYSMLIAMYQTCTYMYLVNNYLTI